LHVWSGTGAKYRDQEELYESFIFTLTLLQGTLGSETSCHMVDREVKMERQK
jgi:hypothetical protein